MATTEAYNVTINPSAAEVITRCKEYISRVGAKLETDDISTYEGLAAARGKIVTMQWSFISGLTSLLRSSDYDGNLHLSLDGEMSLFFRYENSGYHGAMIFHASQKPEDLAVGYGTWRIHT